MEAMFLDLIGLKSEVWNQLFLNRLFSRDKRYNRSAELWLSLVPHKIYVTNVGMQITSLEHPELLLMFLAG